MKKDITEMQITLIEINSRLDSLILLLKKLRKDLRKEIKKSKK